MGGKRQVDVNALIDKSNFNSFTLTVAVICFFAIVFDGLDASLFGTILPVLMKGLKLGPVEAGTLSSVGHIGTVAGAFFFGLAADTIGRKRMLIIGITTFTVFTAACGLAHGFADFALYRLIAGFGLGGVVPIAVALILEYTPLKRRGVVSSTVYMGITGGILMSALLAITFLSTAGWRPILLGTFSCIILIPFAILWLPESMSILVKKGRKESIGKILKKVDPGFIPDVNDEYVLTEPPASKVPLISLFQGVYARNTFLLCTTMLCLMMIGVTLTTWVSQLMIQRGFTLATGLTFILVYAGSNFISTPLAGWMADRIGYKKVFVIYMPILFISESLIGIVPDPVTALICMFFAGFTGTGAICLLLPCAGSLYPLSFRSTAMGVIYSFGRIGAIVGPFLVGVMLAAKISIPMVLIAMVSPSLVALAAFLFVKEAPSQTDLLQTDPLQTVVATESLQP